MISPKRMRKSGHVWNFQITNLKFFHLFWSLLNIFIAGKGRTPKKFKCARISLKRFIFWLNTFFQHFVVSKPKPKLKWGIFVLLSGVHINGRSCNLPLVHTCQQNAICFAYSILDFNIDTAWWPWIQVLLYLSLGKFIISVLYWYLSTSYNNVSVADPTVH